MLRFSRRGDYAEECAGGVQGGAEVAQIDEEVVQNRCRDADAGAGAAIHQPLSQTG